MKTKEIYKLGPGKWGVIVNDDHNNYLTTLTVKTKNFAQRLFNEPQLLKLCVNKNLENN